jgi:hypothetical protein
MKLVLYFILSGTLIQALKPKNHDLRRYRHNLRKRHCSFQKPELEQQKPKLEKQKSELEKPELEKPELEKPELEKPELEKQKPEKQNNGGGLQTTSKATFYFRVGQDVEGCPTVQSFNDGMSYGPCNGNQGVKYTSESKYWAAIKNASGRCGETITVNYNGKSMNLKVMDECPGCAVDNHVDMGLDALIELTGSKEAACAIGTTQPMITWL